MRRILLMAFTLTLLVVSFSVTALPDSNSHVQACVASIPPGIFTGNLDSICASCDNPSDTSGTTGSAAVCMCKNGIQDGVFPGTMGECIQLMHSFGRF